MQHIAFAQDTFYAELPVLCTRVFISHNEMTAKDLAVLFVADFKARGAVENYPNLQDIAEEELVRRKTNDLIGAPLIITREEYSLIPR